MANKQASEPLGTRHGYWYPAEDGLPVSGMHDYATCKLFCNEPRRECLHSCQLCARGLPVAVPDWWSHAFYDT